VRKLSIKTESPAGDLDSVACARVDAKGTAAAQHPQPANLYRQRTPNSERPVDQSRRTVLARSGTTVSDDLLEIALMLEHAEDLDVPRFFATNKCRSHSCESALVYRDMHATKLRASKPTPGV